MAQAVTVAPVAWATSAIQAAPAVTVMPARATVGSPAAAGDRAAPAVPAPLKPQLTGPHLPRCRRASHTHAPALVVEMKSGTNIADSAEKPMPRA